MSKPVVDRVVSYVAGQRERYVGELTELLRVPSVSAVPGHREDVRKAAGMVLAHLRQAGLEAKLVETAGHPIVYGEWLNAPGKPTALVYGHYDVQPPDPLHEWTTPPFEPTVRDGKIFARGATDDKGQMFTHIKGIEAWLKEVGSLPVNVKVIIEGEEEVGSRNLDDFLEQNRDMLKSDVAVVSDTSQYAPGQPAITHGLRGIMACEITLRGPRQDLHSGVFGGAVTNPVNALAALVASLHGADGRVAIEGFYDGVVELTAADRERIAALPFSEREFYQSVGTDAGWGEPGYSPLERRWARPTCDVNGITGGYQGEGPKTIIPAWARAKITCRLVPKQDPEKIAAAIERHLRQRLRPGVTLEFTSAHGCPGFAFDTSSPYMRAAERAIERAFGTRPVFIREGGSIPVVATFRELLAIDTLLLGWGQNTDNLHSPDEHFSLADFQRGILASALLWHELAG